MKNKKQSPAPEDPEYRYLFGPVASRRFGRSLGVDPVPAKTCTFNCIYCQLGRTPNPSPERREWVPVSAILDEMRLWMRLDGQTDVITIAGSGEPTLHARLGEIVAGIREIANEATRPAPPICILTNGSLLHLAEVREDAARADIVKVTFSAPDAETWKRLHRPAPGLRFEDALGGLRAFRDQFEGELRLEVMLIEGFNAAEDQVRQIAEYVRRLRPDRIELNTAIRPPAEKDAPSVSPERLESLALLFQPRAQTLAAKAPETWSAGSSDGDILAVIQRHPATAQEIAAAFHLPAGVVRKRLGALCEAGRAFARDREGQTFYLAADEHG